MGTVRGASEPYMDTGLWAWATLLPLLRTRHCRPRGPRLEALTHGGDRKDPTP